MPEKIFRTVDEKGKTRQTALPEVFAKEALFKTEADFWAEDGKEPIGKTKKEVNSLANEGMKDKRAMFESAKAEADALGLKMDGEFEQRYEKYPDETSDVVKPLMGYHDIQLSNGSETGIKYFEERGDWSVNYNLPNRDDRRPYFTNLKDTLIFVEKFGRQSFEKAQKEAEGLGLTIKGELNFSDTEYFHRHLQHEVLKDGQPTGIEYNVPLTDSGLKDWRFVIRENNGPGKYGKLVDIRNFDSLQDALTNLEEVLTHPEWTVSL